jgi:hypothetical protein
MRQYRYLMCGCFLRVTIILMKDISVLPYRKWILTLKQVIFRDIQEVMILKTYITDANREKQCNVIIRF